MMTRSLLLAAALVAPIFSSASAFKAVPPAARNTPAWSPAVAELGTALRAAPGQAGATPLLGQTLGRLSLELSLRPESAAAAELVRRLPAEAAQPSAFQALPRERRLSLLAEAAAAARAELEPEARALADRLAAGSVSAEDRRGLARALELWFYFAPETARELRAADARLRAESASATGLAIAKKLGGEDRSHDATAFAAAAEVLGGAGVLLGESTAEKGKAVPSLLAPYAERALADAETKAQERGVPAGRVYRAVLEHHNTLFGAVRPASLFRSLRKSGEWTEFAAAVSIEAAERLGTPDEGTRHAVAKAAEGDDLRLAIPSWHRLAGTVPSVAHWLISRHGAPDDKKDHKGLPLGTIFGIPLRMHLSTFAGVLFMGWQFAKPFAAAFPLLTPAGALAFGAISAVVLYAGVVAHEIAHALAARAFGIRTRRMIVNFMGGGAEVVRGFRQSLPEFVIALAGPIMSAAIGFASIWAAPLFAGTMIAPVLVLSGRLNIFLAVLNMLPAFPLDGGRVLRALLTRVLGSYRATKLVAGLTRLGGYGLVAAAALAILSGQPFNFMYMAGGMFLIYASKAMGVHPGTKTIDER